MALWPYPYQRVVNPFVIPPGLLRNAISIQAKSTTSVTGTGSPLAAWNTVWSGMAAILDMGQKESYQSGEFSGQVSQRVSIHYPAGVAIATQMQVLFGSRTFTVQNVINVQERNRILHLYCVEIDGVQ